ncbi:Histone-lysine N-methyltransferase SETMAR [Acromyrmex echinatior]|uniref:Histone-lysine N-methyltransferase SETMAR n=1 Tax=Acromyrmex echinatior TaxID=103372 RepID=F4X315_ACREC|nr:Histone-lysine N-methyltransferase SETMAR [Acromyrmex echinatior]
MSEISEEIRYVMLFYYKKGKNAAQTCRQICEVYSADAVSECRTQEWFVRFRSGNFDVKDRSRSGRPFIEKVDEILQLVKQDRHVSCQEIANALRINRFLTLSSIPDHGGDSVYSTWMHLDKMPGRHRILHNQETSSWVSFPHPVRSSFRNIPDKRLCEDFSPSRKQKKKEDLMDIVDEVFEDANFEAIMDNDEDALSEDNGYNSDQNED